MPKQGDIYRLDTPGGDHPDHFRVRRITPDGEFTYELPWGTDFQVSHHCDPDGKVATLDSGGSYPLIRREFVEDYIDQFTLIKQADS